MMLGSKNQRGQAERARRGASGSRAARSVNKEKSGRACLGYGLLLLLSSPYIRRFHLGIACCVPPSPDWMGGWAGSRDGWTDGCSGWPWGLGLPIRSSSCLCATSDLSSPSYIVSSPLLILPLCYILPIVVLPPAPCPRSLIHPVPHSISLLHIVSHCRHPIKLVCVFLSMVAAPRISQC
jgi:hypothetical protein